MKTESEDDRVKKIIRWLRNQVLIAPAIVIFTVIVVVSSGIKQCTGKSPFELLQELRKKETYDECLAKTQDNLEKIEKCKKEHGIPL